MTRNQAVTAVVAMLAALISLIALNGVNDGSLVVHDAIETVFYGTQSVTPTQTEVPVTPTQTEIWDAEPTSETPIPTMAPTPTMEEVTPVPVACEVYHDGATYYNLRAWGSLSAPLAGRFNPGETATVLAEVSGDWLHVVIRFGEEEGLDAYLADWLSGLVYGANCEN